MARPRNIDREEREAVGKTDSPMFVTWTDNDGKAKAAAMNQMGNAESVVQRSVGAFGLPDGVEMRGGQGDRREFMGRKLRRPRDMMWACMQAYDEFGIVRNVIDTMADFAVQGIEPTHPNVRAEKLCREWWKKVAMPDVAEHIANTLFLVANAPIRRHTATLKVSDQDNLYRGKADIPVGEPIQMKKREIPWGYTIMNPIQMAVLGGDIAPFIGPNAFTYAVEVPAAVLQQIRRPRNQLEKDLIAKLPKNVRQSIKDGLNVIPLASDQMKVLHYKRRHWQVWATPLMYSLLDDLVMLKKLKQADLAALDGAISHIRIWQLGSLENKMMPTQKAIQKLADMLANAGNGMSMDLIWGPDLKFTDTGSDVHKFLGEAKYTPHLNAIYAGFGIPPTLTGASSTGGMTNNFISLKTLTERLQYVRRIVKEFAEYELKLFQQGMGFSGAPGVRFDRMVLTDEAAEKALLIQLADRDLISVETIQARFGEDADLETMRQRREERMRQKKKLPKKASPYHDPQQDYGLEKIFAQTGVVSPGQVGIDLDEKKPGDKSLLDQQGEQTNQQTKLQMQQSEQENDHQFRMEKMQLRNGVHPAQVQMQQLKTGGKPGAKPTQKPVKTGQPQQGRPRNSNDTKPRKKKVVRIRTKAALIESRSWAEDAMRAVAEATTKPFLARCAKKNLRQLTAVEADEFEKFKFHLLMNLSAAVPADKKAIGEALRNPLPIPIVVNELLKQTIERYCAQSGAVPPVEKVREFMVSIAALHKVKLTDRPKAGPVV